MGCKTIGRFTFDNATVEELPINGSVPFSNITTSTDCVSCDGSNITIRKSGAYLVLANFTFAASAAGAVESQMFRNGNAVPGMHAITTAAAADDLVSHSYAQPITIGCNSGEAVLNFKVPQATSVRIASVTVIKVA